MSSQRRHNSEEELIGEQIQSIIAPPLPDKKDRPKASKTGWKKKNREYCEACLDGGELICCEKCPLSFHPQCCDPPCDASDLPDRWICRMCVVVVVASPDTRTDELNPLAILTVESDQQNPSEFDIDQLVKEGGQARRDLPIPGQTRSERGAKKKGAKRDPHEIDPSGLVQLIHTELIKLCQLCSKSSRISQLIQCDFCPLLYHQDCLNPPLTNVPRSKWMCPAHPEKFFTDTQDLFNSQKTQINDFFTGKVDPDSIIQTLLIKRHNTLAATSKLLNRTTLSVANLAAVKSRRRTRQGIVPCGVKRLYRQYRDAKILKTNADVSLFVDSIAKLGADINKNYTPSCGIAAPKAEATLGGIKCEAEELFDAAFADNTGSSPRIGGAILCPIGTNAKPFVFGEKACVKIGSRSDCDVIIDPGPCAAVAAVHAILFREGNNWEILNYAPPGLVVDGVRYGLSSETHADSEPEIELEEPVTNDKFEQLIDVSKYSPTKPPTGLVKRPFETLMTNRVAPSHPPDPDQIEQLKERIHSIQGTLVCNEDKTLTWRAGSTPPVPRKRKRQRDKKRCICDDLEPGWEASAPINHGSLLEIGCHQFLFAITS